MAAARALPALLALLLCAAPRPARAQDAEAGVEVRTCGGCAWRVAGGVLAKSGTCEDDCTGSLYLVGKGIAEIADGALAGLPLVTRLNLGGNKLRALPARGFAGLPRLRVLNLGGNPLAGVDPAAFANISSALEELNVRDTGLGCVPAGDIPATAAIYDYGQVIPRCPAACAPGTVYDASAASCAACPAGLQPTAPSGDVGGVLVTCVPAGWDAAVLAACGSCAFWRAAGTGLLLRTGSCEDDCAGYLFLYDRGIAAVAPGVFEGVPRLWRLFIDGNPLLGCVPGVAAGVEIDSLSPRCPANCSRGTFFVEPRDACATAGDGFCDEPAWCEHGTDCADCADVLGYTACDGSAGACLPCPPGLTTAGVGGAGAASCVEPASLGLAPPTSSSIAATPAPTSSSTTPALTTSSTTPKPARRTSSSTTATPAPASSSTASTATTPAPTACAGAARPLVVAGAGAMCVPERLFPAPEVEHCVFDKTWLDVGEQPDLFTAGGLGKKLTAEWKVWMCAADVPCSAREGDLVCFTFSERHQVFVPWGYNSDLKIIKPK